MSGVGLWGNQKLWSITAFDIISSLDSQLPIPTGNKEMPYGRKEFIG